MKLIVAHLPHDALQTVRTELLDLGVGRITVSAVRTTDAGSQRTLSYRGATMHVEMRSELRLECAAPPVIVPAVLALLREYGDQIALIDLEHHHDAAVTAVALGIAV
jgi:nitrogen regulatory protein PII